jgi:hypothetical protein
MASLTCSDVEFCVIWDKAENLDEVIEKTGAKKFQQVTVKAAFLRKKGIPLKVFPPKTPIKETIDYDKMLEEFAKARGKDLKQVKAEGEKVKAEAIAKAAEVKAAASTPEKLAKAAAKKAAEKAAEEAAAATPSD